MIKASMCLATNDLPKIKSINPKNQALRGAVESIKVENGVAPSLIFSPITILFNSGIVKIDLSQKVGA